MSASAQKLQVAILNELKTNGGMQGLLLKNQIKNGTIRTNLRKKRVNDDTTYEFNLTSRSQKPIYISQIIFNASAVGGGGEGISNIEWVIVEGDAVLPSPQQPPEANSFKQDKLGETSETELLQFREEGQEIPNDSAELLLATQTLTYIGSDEEALRSISSPQTDRMNTQTPFIIAPLRSVPMKIINDGIVEGGTNSLIDITIVGVEVDEDDIKEYMGTIAV